MSSALVLNATYEPLSVVSTTRAACLVIGDKAELVADDGRALRSERFTLPAPSVVRLRYMVNVPFMRAAALSRRAIFARDDHRCQYCAGRADTIDHVMPRSRGGGHRWDNVVAACRACNSSKRDRTPDEAGMRLERPPRTPRPTGRVVLSAARVPEAWRPFLTSAVAARS